MNPLDFTLACAEYVFRTEPGSLIDTVRFRQPRRQEGEVNADLHCHPYISSRKNFWQTLDVMVRNNVDLIAITTHGESTSREMNYWQVKQMIREMTGNVDYQDMGAAFSFKHGGRVLTFVGAFENYTDLPGVEGAMDALALMPDQGFEKRIKPRMPYQDYSDLCREHNGIVIGAHPYTLWDPYGPKHFFRFRLATPDEREAMKDQMFLDADCVDLVASNAAWMVRSNKLLARDYALTAGRGPLSNSDAHSNRQFTRKEIGRSGNLFTFQPYESGEELREQLLKRIKWWDFRAYRNYTPALQFMLSIALDFPEKDFP